MPHPAQQSATGVFVPQALLLDQHLTPLERNTWLAFRALADEDGAVIANHESLRSFLPSAPGSRKAALETVSRPCCACGCLLGSIWCRLAATL
jgi:hypothetical protein